METKVCKCCGKELPITEFRKSHLGTFNTCNTCVKNHQVQARADKKMHKDHEHQIQVARTLKLSDYTPRELLLELKRRGYEFVVKYTVVHTIDSKSLT